MVTIKSAQFINEDNTAVMVITEERGAIAISLKDRPDLWDEYIKSGVLASPFIPLDMDGGLDAEIEKIFADSGFAPALCRVLLSEINILRQAAGMQQRTPQMLLTALKARKRV